MVINIDSLICVFPPAFRYVPCHQVYVQKVSPQKTPMVVGKLLDLDCSEDFIRQLLNSVGHQCPVDELVEQVRTI